MNLNRMMAAMFVIWTISILLAGFILGFNSSHFPIMERQILKGIMWDNDKMTYDQVGMWCQLTNMNETYICKQYHDGWVGIRCEVKETCNGGR